MIYSSLRDATKAVDRYSPCRNRSSPTLVIVSRYLFTATQRLASAILKKSKKKFRNRTPACAVGRHGIPRYPWAPKPAHGLGFGPYARYSYAISVSIKQLRKHDVGLLCVIWNFSKLGGWGACAKVKHKVGAHPPVRNALACARHGDFTRAQLRLLVENTGRGQIWRTSIFDRPRKIVTN